MSTNHSIIQGLYDAFAKGDVPAVLGALSPDVVWNEAEHFPYDDNPYRGPDGVLNGVFANLVADWDGWSVHLEHLLDAGDSVIALGRYRARNKATGADLDAQMVHVWWLEGGKVVRFQQYTDTYQCRKAAGLS